MGVAVDAVGHGEGAFGDELGAQAGADARHSRGETKSVCVCVCCEQRDELLWEGGGMGGML